MTGTIRSRCPGRYRLPAILMRVRPGDLPQWPPELSLKTVCCIIIELRTLSYTHPPGEYGTIQQREVTQVKVAGTDPYHVGAPTAVPAMPVHGS